ncbi:hypothetical protein H1R20_g1162, partial [Candolleomyces eurysporus]
MPRAVELALKPGARRNARLATINLFGRLIGCVHGHGDTHTQSIYENLLGRNSDAAIISRLADIAIKDDEDTLRSAALHVLKSVYETNDPVLTSRFREAIKESLSKVIDNSLKDQENPGGRRNAVSAVNILTQGNTPDRFSGIVSPSIPQLLKIVLVEGDKNLSESVKNVLFGNLTISTPETKLSPDVFTAIPSVATTITPARKAILLQLADSLPIANSTAATRIVNALTPMLRSTSLPARQTAIEILSKLYPRHSLESVGEGQPERSTATVSPVLKQTTPWATKFMSLLQIERLRPSVSALLSLMSQDPAVRQKITRRVTSMALSSDNPALAGHVELLTRLISDGAFSPTTPLPVLVRSHSQT